MSKEENGFSAVVVLLIVVIVGIVGVAGWQVWKSANKTNQTLQNAEKATTASPPSNKKAAAPAPGGQPADETSKWYLYTSRDSVYKIRLADGLHFESADDSPYYSILTLDFNPKDGTRATITPQAGGKDGGVGMVINYFSKASEAASIIQGTKQAELQTTAGLKVQKYHYVQETEPDGLGLPKGATQDDYLVMNGDKTLMISYSYTAEQTAQTDIVEKMVKSVELP